MKKIYAKIHTPEQTQYDFWLGDIDDRIIIHGNERERGLNDGYIYEAKNAMDNWFYYEDAENGEEDFAADYRIKLPKDRLEQLFKHLRRGEESEALLLFLESYCREPYDVTEIRGCSQGEWNYLYYPESISREAIEFAEAVWYGTGNEISAYSDPTTVGFDDEAEADFTFYTAEWSDQGIKKAVMDAYGYREGEAEVVLFKPTNPRTYTVWDYERV